MAYGYQYIPEERGDRSAHARAPGSVVGQEPSVSARIFRVAPAASAIADAIDSIYRDIEELRVSGPEMTAGRKHPRSVVRAGT